MALELLRAALHDVLHFERSVGILGKELLKLVEDDEDERQPIRLGRE